MEDKKSKANQPAAKVEDILQPGTYVISGKYKIEKKIGAGGMAQVYKAVAIDDNSVVAIKVNTKKFNSVAQQESFIASYRNEVNNIAKLNNNQNVIRLIDYEVEQDKPWMIVLEYADGGTLSNYIQTYKFFTVNEIQYYFSQIANALKEAHHYNIIHRDIKPENVFLTSAGTVKLGDFGISFPEDDELQAKKTIGTPKYIPPEIIMHSPANKKSDIYSLGVMLYLFSTGTTPFTSTKLNTEGQQELFNKHVKLNPIRPSDINPKIPPKLSNLILMMIEKSPEDRIATMEEVYLKLTDPNLYDYEKPYEYKGNIILGVDERKPKTANKLVRTTDEKLPFFLTKKSIYLYVTLFTLLTIGLLISFCFSLI